MKSLLAIVLGLGSVAAMQIACGALESPGKLDDSSGPTSSSSSLSTTGAGGGDAGIDAQFGTGGGTAPLGYSAMCGDGCLPETGVAGPCELPPDGDGGSAGEDGGSGGTTSGAGGGSGQCVLVADSDGIHGACEEPGQNLNNDPCLNASDCAPGLGCIAPGVCRPYCCGNLEACPASTYCAPAPLAVADVPPGVRAAPLIPVCVQATMCQLLDDNVMACPEGQSCTIVRADGTTSCVTPGPGELGDECGTPTGCAAGYVCSTSVNECFKLCHLNDPTECPADHTCQGGSSSYPPDFGVCIAN